MRHRAACFCCAFRRDWPFPTKTVRSSRIPRAPAMMTKCFDIGRILNCGMLDPIQSGPSST